MGEKGEGSGGEGGGKWGERGRELGMGYPPVHPLSLQRSVILKTKLCVPPPPICNCFLRACAEILV